MSSAATSRNVRRPRGRRSWRTVGGVILSRLLLVVAEAKEWQIDIEDYVFLPDRLVVSVGDTVTWTSNAFDHTVTSDTESFNSQTLWDYMPYGGKFSHTFVEEGVYPYFCQGHGGPGGSGMSGTITVVASTAVNRNPATPTGVSPADGAVDQAVAITLVASPFRDLDAGDFHAASQWVVRRLADGQVVADSGASKTNLTLFKPPGLSGAEAYSWQVRYQDGQGGWSGLSAAARFTTLQAVTRTGTGLRVEYFNDPNGLASRSGALAAATNGLVDFQWGSARPHRRITADGFGARWEGALLPGFTEKYEFQTRTRGGVRLWVHGRLLIDEWDACSFARTWRGGLDLVAGQAVAIRLEYSAEPGDALLSLRWGSPSQPVETIPAARLFPPGVLPGL